jgi:SAM-dependent methyltransferase
MRALVCGAVSVSFLAILSAQTNSRAEYLTHTQAAPVLAALDHPVPAAGDWSRWIAAADTATRARVAQGDEASIVNLLLFGTSFTTQPRITSRLLDREQIQRALDRRLDDFERAIAQPGAGERLQYARRLLGDGTSRRLHLLAILERTMKEGELVARLSAEAQRLDDPSLQFAERSRLYRDRGLASDTSVRINFAVEEALKGVAASLERGSDARNSVRRVAVIGPGLDFADKQEGYDFYPLQTLQPFAIFDSLVRLGLADVATLQVTTLDISSRVNDHITEMSRKARLGLPYSLHVPLDGNVSWTPQLLSYFSQFGASVGSAVPASVPPGLGPLKLRAVAVRPAVAERISPRDVNITAQLLPLADSERFDLIVGTNVFVYYDRLQQGLAMASLAAMLRPGGLLLSNNALVEVPSSGMHSIGYSRTLYSNREEDGDVVISYQKRIK